jgi:LCP family protein required for cell wall assembly
MRLFARPTTTKQLLHRLGLLTGIPMLLLSGWLGFLVYRSAAQITGSANPIKLVSSFTPSTLKMTNGRINILLAGYSADDAGHSGAQLTDSIMILSINPADKSAVMISVPRDLYVNIAGFGYAKINEAYYDGGMNLLEQTVSDDFGVNIGYYALIDYTAVKSAVDAVGGVTVTINSSDPRGLYDPNTNLRLSNGSVTLDGQTALNLVRSRGDGYGSYGFENYDFSRTANQQLVLLALKSAAVSAVKNPIAAGKLVSALGNNIKTDMTIGELETLYLKTKNLDTSHVKSVTLNSADGTNYLSSYTSPTGQSTLIPASGISNYTAIQELVSSLLKTSI